MSLIRTISDSPAAVVAGALAGALLAPAAAAATVTVPGGRWPWQADASRWLFGEPATIGRRTLLILSGIAVLGSLAAVIGWRPATLAFVSTGLVGVMLCVIDLEHHRLPNRLTATGAVVASAALALDAVLTGSWSALLRAAICAAVVFTAFLLIALIGPRGMGFGDVKLAALLTLHTGWLGWELAILGLLAGFILGGLAALLLVATRRVSLRTPIPFGPALLVGAWLIVLASGNAP